MIWIIIWVVFNFVDLLQTNYIVVVRGGRETMFLKLFLKRRQSMKAKRIIILRWKVFFTAFFIGLFLYFQWSMWWMCIIVGAVVTFHFIQISRGKK